VTKFRLLVMFVLLTFFINCAFRPGMFFFCFNFRFLELEIDKNVTVLYMYN